MGNKWWLAVVVVTTLCPWVGCKLLYSYDPNSHSDGRVPHDAPFGDRQISLIDTLRTDTSTQPDTTSAKLCEGSVGRRITIDSARVLGNEDLLDFPLLVAVENDSSLKVSPAGQVHHGSGVDIYFTANDGVSSLDYEIEHYDGSDGTLVAWVRIPVLSASNDTSIVMCYGDPMVTVPRATPADVWDSSYMAVWHLKTQGTGAIDEFVDSTRNANHGQGGYYRIAGLPQRVEGMFGYGQSFDGNDDHIRAPSSPTLDLDGAVEMTVEAWVWNSQSLLSTSAGICSKRGYSSGYRIVTGDSGRYWCQFSGATYPALLSTDNWSQGAWQHVAATLKDGQSMLYIDGKKDPRESPGPTSIAVEPYSGVMIGHGDDYIRSPYAFPFPGVIDEVRISSKARTWAWIATQYNNYASPSVFYSVSAVL